MSESLDNFIRMAVPAGEGADLASELRADHCAPGGMLGDLPGHAVESLLARGGMGVVYQARQHALEREVAVKVMTGRAETPEMAERFRREALVLGRLAHPNIVPVYDIGMDAEGQLFYTMKLVRGRTLQEILHALRQGHSETAAAHPLTVLLTVFRKVCDALSFAHAQGIIHRDLKPENIMVGEFGEVLVMDWGLAKWLGGAGDNPGEMSLTALAALPPPSAFSGTLQGSVMGTPQYMSPEQARGEIDALDARSDIFSLGGMLYALLTLRPPVEGASVAEVLGKVRTGSITPLRPTRSRAPVEPAAGILGVSPPKAGGRVPEALAAVVLKAMRLAREERYQTVAALSADIEAWMGGFATSAEQAGVWKQLTLLVKRHRGIFSTVAAAWLLLSILGAWFLLNLQAKERRAVAGERSAKTAEAIAVLEKDSARQALVITSVTLAEASLREADGPQMQAALNEVPAELRDDTWRYLFAQSDTSIARFRPSVDFKDVAADPVHVGAFFLADGGSKITVVEARTGQVLRRFETGFPAGSGGRSLALSPDGERLALGRLDGDGGLMILSARDGKKLAAWEAPPSRELAFSPDGTLLLQVLAGIPSLKVWGSADGRLRWNYEVPRSATAGAFTLTGRQFVTANNVDGLRLVNAEDGTLVRQIAKGIALPVAMKLRADGMVAMTMQDGEIVVMETRDGNVITRFKAENEGARPPTVFAGWRLPIVTWTADGTGLVLAWLAADGRQKIQLRNPRTAAVIRSLLGGLGPLAAMSIHPLSGELVSAGAEARAWNFTGTPPKLTVRIAAGGTLKFFGSDDVIFARHTREGLRGSTVQKLGPDGPVPIWRPSLDVTFDNQSVSADGRFAVVSDSPASILLLRRDGEQISPVSSIPSARMGRFLRLSPTGDRVVAGSGGSLDLLATDTGEKVCEPEPACRDLHDLAWLGSDRLVGLGTVNGLRLERATEERVLLWDSATGKILKTAANRTAMDVLAVAPDGSRFAEAGLDKRVRVRDGKTLAVQRDFRAHDGPITAMAWHPTRPILATASSTDLNIRLWDLETRDLVEELRGPTKPPRQLAFSPSGRLLGCASDDEALRLWEVPLLSEKKRATATPPAARPSPPRHPPAAPPSGQSPLPAARETSRAADVP